MNKLDENTTLEQLRMYLSDAEQRAETLNWIKTAVSKHDDVNGLVLYLKAKNWDVEALEKLDFDGTEKQRKLELKINRSNYLWFKVAAVIIPLVGLCSLFYFQQQQTLPSDIIFTQYYVPEKGLPTLMSNNSEKYFNEAMSAFRDEAYEEAKVKFEKLDVNNSTNDTLNYYLACTYMELGLYGNATQRFEKVDNLGVFNDKAEYRKALCYTKLGMVTKAKKIFMGIKLIVDHQYNREAVSILGEDIFNKKDQR